LWGTPTKPDYKAVGLGLIGLYNAALRIPYVAIGGIDENNLADVLSSGAKTIAVVRALFDAHDPENLAREFKDKLEGKVWL
jgi:thiamine-phosphate pyrophosphorylase